MATKQHHKLVPIPVKNNPRGVSWSVNEKLDYANKKIDKINKWTQR
jgi:hypothetical protein